MTTFGFRSVFSRLFISVFLALLVFAVSMFAWIHIVHNDSDALKQRSIARQIATQIDPFLTKTREQAAAGNRVQVRFSLAVIKKSFDIFDESLNAKIGLYDTSGRLLLQTDNSVLPEVITPKSWLDELMPSLWRAPHNHVQVKTPSGFTIWYESRNPPPNSRFASFFNLFTGTILLLVIMTGVLWVIAKNMTHRLDEMSKQMLLLGEGDFGVRVREQGNDEISVLARGFNQSAQKIERLINANNLLLAHASHEFRTPITRMRLQTEMLAMLADKLQHEDKTQLNRRTDAINRDLTGLNDLIESILLVSRLDAGHALEQMQTVDLYELVASECQHYTQVHLYGQSVCLHAQSNLLLHLVRNLLNNALNHGTPPVCAYVYGCQTSDETITIPNELIASGELPEHQDTPDNSTPLGDLGDLQLSNVQPSNQQSNNLHPSELGKDNSAKEHSKEHSKEERSFFRRFKKSALVSKPAFAVLAIIDQGDGIAMDKREDIFSPFVRLKQEKKGSGLGLSLVAQIVEMHGGRILTDTWQGNTRFLVVLPIQQKPILSDKPKKEIHKESTVLL